MKEMEYPFDAELLLKKKIKLKKALLERSEDVVGLKNVGQLIDLIEEQVD